jgi:hypothetical protein
MSHHLPMISEPTLEARLALEQTMARIEGAYAPSSIRAYRADLLERLLTATEMDLRGLRDRAMAACNGSNCDGG